MLSKRLVATILLAAGAALIAAQVPTDVVAQDTKAEKKALRKKLLEERRKKAEAEAAKAKPETESVTPPKAETKLAETRPATPMDARAVAKLIDREIDKALAAAKVTPSPRSTDAEFLRRVSLDITGVIPSAERVERFLADTDPDKRAKLVDELLASPRYGAHLADGWGRLMFPVETDNRFVVKEPLVKALAEDFNANKPWDRMVHDLLTATGEQEKNGEVTYFLANRGVDKLTDSVGKLFLGVQIQCAQCHNHPFTHWKQAEYWGMAQFFYKVNAQVNRNAKTDVTNQVQEVNRPQRKVNPLPESAKNVPPKFLGGEQPKLDPAKPYRPALADWVCSPENPFFGKAIVNRVWGQYFGRGFVNPVDDLADENEPTHPELFAALAKEFAAGGFDLKQLTRAIVLSDAYQRSSVPAPENKGDAVLYSHMAVKVLTPEQLFDSLAAVVGEPGGGAGNAPKKGQRNGNTPRERFVAFFSGSDNPRPTEYEAGIPQALRLMNNPRLAGAPALLNALAKGADKPEKGVEKLYLMTLGRKPTAAESRKLTEYVAKATDAKGAYGDVLWALLNSSEFALNH
jgi:hypothetical protein